MNFYFNILVAILGSFVLCQAAPKEDLVEDLPGLSQQPSFKHYSGYLQASGSRKLHYWFVESSSNPSKDPVVLWMNGGPGCSSLDGMVSEHGPFRVQSDGLTVKYNPYSWNQAANMIYLEAPAGVGFSYSLDGNYTTNDAETAHNNLLALKDFFTKFPEFKGNDFYITGESYGGIYVPTLAADVIDDGSMNLKGFAVGNGLSDTTMNTNSLVFFAYYHGLIEQSMWDELVDACCPSKVSDNCDFVQGAGSSDACGNQLGSIQTLVWSSGLDPYNLYADCAVDNTLHYDKQLGKYVSRNIMNPFYFLPHNDKEKAFLKLLPKSSVSVSPPCINTTAATTYLNLPQVRQALHIPNSVQDWTVCASIDYRTQYQTMTPFYKKAIDNRLRVLVYNGDVDMACNFLGDEWFVDSLKLQELQGRKFWYYKDEMGSKVIAGFVKVFDTITLVTIKGAGHMVPSDKPIPALEMFINFIQDRMF